MAHGALTKLLACLLLAGCVATPQPERRWTVADYAEAATFNDDPMSTSITLVSGGPRAHRVHPDFYSNALRLGAVFDRRARAEQILVSLQVHHRAEGWISFTGATYRASDGVARQGSSFTTLSSEVDCKGGCNYREGGAFAISERELQQIVDLGRAERGSNFWPVRFEGRRFNVDTVFTYDEVEGFLAALRKARARVEAARAR